MIGRFISNRLQIVRRWWRAPVTVGVRFGGAFVGVVAFFFIGAIARAMIGARPVPFSTLGLWGSGFSGVGMIVGIRFPKITTCLLMPLFFVG